MNIIKYALSTAGLATALVIGGLAPVAASSTTTNTNIDNSVDNSIHQNGDCDVIADVNVNQEQNNLTDQTNASVPVNDQTNVGVLTDDQTQSNNSDQNSGDQSNSVNNTQSSSVTIAPDCSQENVTNVTKQVVAPAGAVSAGAGGAVGSAAAPLFGFGGSLASIGYGMLRLRKRA